MIVRELLTRLAYQTDDKGARDYEARLERVRRIAVGVVAAVGAVGTVIALAGDRMTSSLAKIESAIGRSSTSAAEAQDVYDRLYDISLRTGVAADDSADAFTRFNLAMRDLGRPAQDTIDLIEGLQAAAITAGISTEDLTGTMVQLGQALASGRLQGDEMARLRESMPAFLREISSAMGMTLQQFMEASEKGLLTPARLVPAMLNASANARAELARFPLTMDRSFRILRNTSQRFLADLDKALKLSRTMAQLFSAVAQQIERWRASLPALEQWIERLGGLPRILRAVAFGIVGMTIATRGFTVALAMAKWAVRALMTAIGPFGIAMVALGLILEDIFTWLTETDVDTLMGQMFGSPAEFVASLRAAWESFINWFSSAWDRFINSEQTQEMGRIMAAVAGLVLAAWQPVKDFFVSLWEAVKSGANEVKEALQPIIDFVRELTAAWDRFVGGPAAPETPVAPRTGSTVGEAQTGGTGITIDPTTGQRRVRQGINRAGRSPITLQNFEALDGYMQGLGERAVGGPQNIHQEAVVNINQTVNATGPNPAELAAAASSGVHHASGASVAAWRDQFGREIAGANPRAEPAAL